MLPRGSGDHSPCVSVLMPTFNQVSFIRRALDSLYAQTHTNWELIIVDDGSPDDTHTVISTYLHDVRIQYHRWDTNRGLGVALNDALVRAVAPLVSYLPSDDVWYAEHLASLVGLLDARPDAALAFAGMRHHSNQSALGKSEDIPLQLVQVMHRRTVDRWVERSELVTDDLERMFWAKLRSRGAFIGTGHLSCEWVDHPLQRHKVVQERPGGGLNPYRSRYGVTAPVRFQPSIGNWIDEVAHYRQFRERSDTPFAADGLKIVLVGELAFNPERVLALEERGHKLYGLWTPDPWNFNTVGPLPFGHVQDLPRKGWREAMRQVHPDVIYALLNWQAVPFAHQVLTDNPGIPFVWHFKEGPFFCLEKGTWPLLVDLVARSDGQVYSSPEMREWFRTAVSGSVDDQPSLVLDGDLPKRDWFTDDRSPRLSEQDGKVHTVVSGRPAGMEVGTVAALARHDIHLHCYGAFQGPGLAWLREARRMAPDHLHVHPLVGQECWVAEFSQYDAGWLHLFKSDNGGDLRRANWDDLNYPARIATLAAAGLPFIQYDNGDAVVATQTLARRLDLGLFLGDIAQLAEEIRDGARMTRLRENAWHQRQTFTFDHHADRLIAFFRDVIANRKSRTKREFVTGEAGVT